MTPYDPPRDHPAVLPQGRELSLLLELRSRAHRLRRPGCHAGDNDLFSHADLLTTAFLLAEAGTSMLIVDDPALASLLRDAGLSSYSLQRNAVPLTVEAAALESLVNPALPPTAALLWSAGNAAACPAGKLEDGHYLILYGLCGPVDLRALAALFDQLATANWTTLSLAARVLSLWRASSLLLTSAAHAGRHAAALSRLESILRDTTLDPLALAEEVFRLRSERSVEPPLESTRVSDLMRRIGELEEEVLLLRDRLEKQQSALVLERYPTPGMPASPLGPGQGSL